MQDRTAAYTQTVQDINMAFPAHLTRVLLPLLSANSPSLIQNIGSAAAEVPGPYLAVYSGTKAFIRHWSTSLGVETRAEGTAIEVMCILVGMVATTPQGFTEGWLIPGPRRMAKSALDVVGCGRSAVWAYWPHALQFGGIAGLPGWMRERAVLRIAGEERRKEEGKFGKVA